MAFKKGQSGNPSGRPKLDEGTKRIRALTNDELKEMGEYILMGSRARLREVMDDPNSPPLKCWIAAATLKGIQSGDMGSLNELLNRLIGKVTDKIEHTGVSLTIIEKLDGSETHLGAKVIEDKR
jgi:hypothetical protein